MPQKTAPLRRLAKKRACFADFYRGKQRFAEESLCAKHFKALAAFIAFPPVRTGIKSLRIS
jgi:hypothetical protein